MIETGFTYLVNTIVHMNLWISIGYKIQISYEYLYYFLNYEVRNSRAEGVLIFYR